MGGELNLRGRGETGCFRFRIASREYVLSQGTYTDRPAFARLPTASLTLGDFVYLIRVEDMLRWCEEQKQTAIETERPKGRATIAKDVQEQAVRRQCEEEKQQVLAVDVKPSKVSGYQNRVQFPNIHDIFQKSPFVQAERAVVGERSGLLAKG